MPGSRAAMESGAALGPWGPLGRSEGAEAPQGRWHSTLGPLLPGDQDFRGVGGQPATQSSGAGMQHPGCAALGTRCTWGTRGTQRLRQGGWQGAVLSAWDAQRLAESWSSRTRKARNTGSRDPRAPTRGRFLFPGAFLCFPHQACFPFILRGRKPHRCNKRNTKRNSHPLGHSAVSIRSSACLNSILHLTRKPKCSSLLFTEVW